MKKIISITSSLIIVFLFISLSGINFTKAATGLTIQPIKISHTIEPGQSATGIITLENNSDERTKVEVKVEDFVPDAGSTNINFIGRAEGLTTVRDWITIGGEQSFFFNKGESRSITYTIKAPDNAEPGGHFGVAFFKASKADDGGAQLKVSTQVGVLILVTVPGNFLQKGKILDFSAPSFIQKGPVNFNVKFENTGTVHFEPKGKIKITNIFGKEVGEVPVRGQVVLPTGVRDLNAQWEVAGVLLGRYKATVSIFDGVGNVLTAEDIVFYASPIWYILEFILAIAVLFVALKFLRRKVKFSVSLKK